MSSDTLVGIILQMHVIVAISVVEFIVCMEYGQNGDRPKQRKSKRRQAKGNITETATKTCGQNGDKGQQNACRKFTLSSTRRHDSG